MYKVIVADNYHYQDDDESYVSGSYATLEEAINKCREIVESSLSSCYKPGMTSDELFDHYKSFGEDPYIEADSIFSAWTYAEQRCDEICNTFTNQITQENTYQ